MKTNILKYIVAIAMVAIAFNVWAYSGMECQSVDGKIVETCQAPPVSCTGVCYKNVKLPQDAVCKRCYEVLVQYVPKTCDTVSPYPCNGATGLSGTCGPGLGTCGCTYAKGATPVSLPLLYGNCN